MLSKKCHMWLFSIQLINSYLGCTWIAMDRICIWEMLKFRELLHDLIFLRTATLEKFEQFHPPMSLLWGVSINEWIGQDGTCLEMDAAKREAGERMGAFLEKMFLYKYLACSKILLQTKPQGQALPAVQWEQQSYKSAPNLQFLQGTKYTDTKCSTIPQNIAQSSAQIF